MQLTESLKSVFIETSKALRGSERRLFMARAVLVLGPGGQRLAEAELGWNRGTIRKGMRELASGIRCHDAFTDRGRRRIEERLPNLLADIKAIVDTQSQTDPSFKSTRLYTRLSSAEVRRQLIAQKQYTDSELPSEQTIRRRLNHLGYHPARVAKTKPLKTIPETENILAKVTQINLDADTDETVLRLSLDAKAVVKLGEFDRGGKTRVDTVAFDHDFNANGTVTPYGIFLPFLAELFLYFTTSKITSDFIVDRLEQWWESVRGRFGQIRTLVLNQDNGPENNSRRTQFIKRIVEFAHKYQLNIRLAYYPPYFSKYNPIERTWAILENHWNGSLLSDVETVLRFAQTMTWKGKQPTVTLVTDTYKTGISLTKPEMAVYESQIQRLSNRELEDLPNLGKWFVDISCRAA